MDNYCVRKQLIIALYFESETILRFYNLEVWYTFSISSPFQVHTILIALTAMPAKEASVLLLTLYLGFFLFGPSFLIVFPSCFAITLMKERERERERESLLL